VICIAHRGASGYEPENTLLAIRRALELGAEWLEIDVYCVERTLIVIHDDTLERSTNGKGAVMSSTLRYLRSLDAGKGEPIPLLEEVCALIGPNVGLNVELKGPETAEPVAAFFQKKFSAGWPSEQILISSFDISALKLAKEKNAKLRIGTLKRKGDLAQILEATKLGAYSVNTSLEFVNESFIEAAHAANLKVFVYTVNEESDIERMRAWKVDGVFSDFPDRVLTTRTVPC
jgi:glycerophosphoryl diester phosphodiesterase